MEVHVTGYVENPAQMQADMTAALKAPVTLVLDGGEGPPHLTPGYAQAAVDALQAVAEAATSKEGRDLDMLATKARAVLRGEETFTPAQAQRILAALVVVEARGRR